MPPHRKESTLPHIANCGTRFAHDQPAYPRPAGLRADAKSHMALTAEQLGKAVMAPTRQVGVQMMAAVDAVIDTIFFNSQKDEGIEPVNSVDESDKISSEEVGPIPEGIVPDSGLKATDKDCRCVNSP